MSIGYMIYQWRPVILAIIILLGLDMDKSMAYAAPKQLNTQKMHGTLQIWNILMDRIGHTTVDEKKNLLFLLWAKMIYDNGISK